MKVFSIVVLLLTGCSGLAQETHNRILCETRLKISGAVKNIEISEGTLRAGMEFTTVNMTIKNKTDAALTEYGLLLELFDSSHKRLLSIVFHQAAQEQSFAPAWMVPSYELKEPINSRGTLEVTGQTPVISSTCPASAAITFAFLRFENGKVVTTASPGWRADPAVRISTDHMVLDQCTVPKDASASAIVRINSRGHLDSFHLRGSDIPETLRNCLRNELSSWEFTPAIVDGRSVPSEIRLVVLFEPQAELSAHWPLEYPMAVKSGVSLLELQPLIAAQNGSQWIASYGGGCCVTLSRSHP